MSRRRAHWTAAQDHFIESSLHHMRHAEIAQALGKSTPQICRRCTELGLTMRTAGYTLQDLALGFGRSQRLIHRWIDTGLLKATHRNSARKRDYWFVSDAALYRFIHAHPEEIDMQRVDKLWFQDVSTRRGIGSLVQPMD